MPPALLGKSRNKRIARMTKRTAKERMNAIPGVIARTEEFKLRVVASEGDAVRCADLMAEAIAMDREARGLGYVGRDGRSYFEFERMHACYCLDDSRAAYLRARGSNSTNGQGAPTTEENK